MPEKLLKDVTEENPDLSLPEENPDIPPETLTSSYIKSAYIPSEPQEMLDLYAKRRYVEEKGAAAIRLLQKHNKLTPELANRFAPPEPELVQGEPRGISLFERLGTFLRGEPQTRIVKVEGESIIEQTAGRVTPSEIVQAEERLKRIPPSIEKPVGIEQVGRLGKGLVGGVVGTAEGMVGTAEWLSGGVIGRDLGNTLRQIGESLRPTDPNFADALASGFGSALTFAIPGFGISAGTARLGLLAPKLASWAGITTSSAMEAMTEAGSVYRNVKEKTGDIQKADNAAKYTFLWNMPLLLVTNKLGIFGQKGGALRRAVVSSQMEGLQEVLQEKVAGEAEQRRVTFGQYATAYGVGALTGAGIGGLAKYIDIGFKQLAKQTGQEENTLKQDIEIKAGITGKPVEEILDDRLRMTLSELAEEEKALTQAEANAMEQFTKTAGIPTPTETIPTQPTELVPPSKPTITEPIKQGEGETLKAGEVPQAQAKEPIVEEKIKKAIEASEFKIEYIKQPLNIAIEKGKEANEFEGLINSKGYEFVGLVQTKESPYVQWRWFYKKGDKVYAGGESSKIKALEQIRQQWQKVEIQPTKAPWQTKEKKLTIQQDIDKLIQEGASPKIFEGPLTIFEKLKEKGIEHIAITQEIKNHLDPEEIKAIGKQKIGFFRKEVTPQSRPFDEVAATVGMEVDDLADALRTAKTRRQAFDDIKRQIEIQKEGVNPPVQVGELELEQGDKFQIAGEDYKVTDKTGEVLTIKNKETFKVKPTDEIPSPDIGSIEYTGTEFPPSEQPTIRQFNRQVKEALVNEAYPQGITRAGELISPKELSETQIDNLLADYYKTPETFAKAQADIVKKLQIRQPITPKTGIERGGVKFISNAAIIDVLKRLDAAQTTKTSSEEIKKLNTELANLLQQAQIKVDETQRIADAEGVTTDDILTITLSDGRTQQINLARFNSSEGGLTQLDKIVSALGEAVRGKRTDEELRADAETEAANIGLTKVQLENLRKNIGNADKLIVASGIVIKTLDENARLINDAILANPSNENLAPFLFEILGQQRDVLVTITQIGTEGGRLLRAFGLGVEESKQRISGLEKLLEGTKKGNISIQDFAIKYRKLIGIRQRNVFLKSPTISDAFLEAWINGLLSGIPTHVTNVVGNSTAIVMALAETRIAESLPFGSTPSGMTSVKIQGLVNGMMDVFTLLKKANESIPQERQVSNETTQVFSLSKKLEKIEQLVKTLRSGTGEESQKFGTKRKSFVGETFGATGELAKAIDLMGEYIRIPGQALMTVDEFFKVINYRMELHAQAYATALGEGLQGKDLTDRMAEIVANPPETIHLEAKGFAFYNTFSQALGRMGSAISKFAESHVFAKMTVPFVTISANLMKYTFERTPLAFMSQKIRADWRAGGMKKDMVEAKVAMGSMIMATAAAAAMAGLITGGGPREPELRKLWLASGKKPYSIKIGDTYYSYSRIEPIGSLFGLVANFVEIAQNTDIDTASKIAMAIFLPFSDVFLHKTYLSGLSNTFDAIQHPAVGGPKYVKNLFKTIMPRIGANFAKVIDPQIREVHGMLDALIADTPGWSMTLPPKRDIFGNPQMYEGGYANLISPIYIATEKHDPVIDEILKQRVSLSMPANYLGGAKPPSYGELRPIHGVQLDPYQYDRLVQIVGKEIKSDGYNLHDTLAVIMKTPFYQAMSEGQDGGRAKIIRTVVNSFKESGELKFLMENPTVNSKIRQRKLQKQQALAPTIQ